MDINAVVLDGKKSVHLSKVQLPEIKDNEILVKIICNSICLSTYKAALLGEDHKRVPKDIHEKPIITGHEFCGIIEKVGKKYQSQYKKGERFVLQPAMGLESGYSAGYSYQYYGGNATYCIIPEISIELGCLIKYDSNYFANASLAEPMSCIIGAYHASYHTKQYVYKHDMGIKEGGTLALIGCCGPMGLGAIEYGINGPVKPKRIIVLDVDQARMNRARSIFHPKNGVELEFLDSTKVTAEEIIAHNDGKKFDDVFVFVANQAAIQTANEILGTDGCMNFFAGPMDKQFNANFNFYNVHYESTHIVGTSGGSTDDMLESINLSKAGIINPSYMITHIGGLNAAADTILNLPNIPGGKKLIYTHIDMPLTSIEDFAKLKDTSELYKNLYELCLKHNNVWNQEAEEYLLTYYNVI